jgi:hypothetical protein
VNCVFSITSTLKLDTQFIWLETVMAAMLKVGWVSRLMKEELRFNVILTELINAEYLKGGKQCQLIPSFK